MQLALVKGRATATVKHPSMNGQKLLVCMQLDPKGKPVGDPIIAIDQLGAGGGETVLLSSDGAAVREKLGDDSTPVRWFTLGIVDEKNVEV
jgi:ethanolamine utilization protein EutN